ncbi:unnamed protein product [Paramecium octaurelia]|uniref:Uncharacterized protein n=1 Tax=Paramecium octaurelia TaxID=43137 RepID=A0A8S1YM76_PAROT|nr:unnamed protein product [Paramecium octaurelia]
MRTINKQFKLKVFNVNIVLLLMLASLSCVQSQCIEITDQKQCNQDQRCEWNYWEPSKCQNMCSQLINQTACNQVANCKWKASSSSCLNKKMHRRIINGWLSSNCGLHLEEVKMLGLIMR